MKHLAMFNTAFYACLRASELCDLDVEDIHLDKLSLVVRNGKGGKTSVCYLSEGAIEILREYMSIRPDFELEGRKPLFFTDYGDRFNRKEIYRLVIYYKEKAGIKKPGGAHVLFRHTPASIMVQNGCDLLTIQQVMRHNHIQTTCDICTWPMIQNGPIMIVSLSYRMAIGKAFPLNRICTIE